MPAPFPFIPGPRPKPGDSQIDGIQRFEAIAPPGVDWGDRVIMFLNPVMLAGVGGAVVPLVLHFLSRSRFRTVDWGGMMFLGEPTGRRLSGAVIRQWTLLGLRMAIVGLLAVALARPVVAGLSGGG